MHAVELMQPPMQSVLPLNGIIAAPRIKYLNHFGAEQCGYRTKCSKETLCAIVLHHSFLCMRHELALILCHVNHYCEHNGTDRS
jgi:hypothetical protein